MLTGSASKEEQRAILQRLSQNPRSDRRLSAMDGDREKEIKLIYVTVSIFQLCGWQYTNLTK
jgi:hypothetical protein